MLVSVLFHLSCELAHQASPENNSSLFFHKQQYFKLILKSPKKNVEYLEGESWKTKSKKNQGDKIIKLKRFMSGSCPFGDTDLIYIWKNIFKWTKFPFSCGHFSLLTFALDIVILNQYKFI